MKKPSGKREGNKYRFLEFIVTTFIGMVMIAIFIKIVFY
jgi:hypothetical protein